MTLVVVAPVSEPHVGWQLEPPALIAHVTPLFEESFWTVALKVMAASPGAILLILFVIVTMIAGGGGGDELELLPDPQPVTKIMATPQMSASWPNENRFIDFLPIFSDTLSLQRT